MRKQLLLDLFDGKEQKVIEPLVDEILYLESQVKSLKSMPFILVHPKRDGVQKITQAGKLYKEYLNQYTNGIKTLLGLSRKAEQGENKSPLRLYLEKLESDKEN